MNWSTTVGLVAVVWILAYLDEILDEIKNALGGDRSGSDVPVDRAQGAPPGPADFQADAGFAGFVQETFGYCTVPPDASYVDINPTQSASFVYDVDQAAEADMMRSGVPVKLIRRTHVNGVTQLYGVILTNERCAYIEEYGRVRVDERWVTFERVFGGSRRVLDELMALIRAGQIREGL